MPRVIETDHSASPILGDLSSVVGEGNRVRCPRCQKLRAFLLLIRARGVTEPMCSSCQHHRTT